MQTVVITGAAGKIGSAIRPLLQRPGRKLVLVDVKEPARLTDAESFHRVDVNDADRMAAVIQGVSAVVHLAGIPVEAAWEDLTRTNIDGTRVVLEAVRRGGVPAILLASTIHAVGLATLGEAIDRPDLPPRPDSYYGVTKATLEALGALYADRFNVSVVAARICAFGDQPSLTDPWAAATWLSPGDMTRLIEAVLRPLEPGYHLVWGISATGADLLGLTDQGIGYRPADYASQSLGELRNEALLGADAADRSNRPGQPW